MIRVLVEGDAADYAELRRQALVASPLAFASSAEDDIASTAEAVREHLRRGPGSVIFGAFRPGLVGAVGMYRDRHLKCAHKVHLWGMYVVPGSRRQGVGRELLRVAVEHARRLDGVDRVLLSVSAAAPEALRLYEAAGFRTWGTEPDALRHEGTIAGEHHMSLQLADRIQGSTTGLEVRTYDHRDFAEVAGLWGAVFPDDPPWNEPAAVVRRKLRVQHDLFLIGRLEGRLVAAVIGGFDGFRGWVYHLAVAADRRRQGLGRRMMQAAEGRLRALGCPKVNLQVRKANREAVAFCEALGYRRENRVSMGKRLE